jgi:hypothetical protein
MSVSSLISLEPSASTGPEHGAGHDGALVVGKTRAASATATRESDLIRCGRFASSREDPRALGNLLGDFPLGRREAPPAVLALAAATD